MHAVIVWFFADSPTNSSVFHLHVAASRYTSEPLTITRRARLAESKDIVRHRGRGNGRIIFSTWYTQAHANVYVHARWIMLKRTFKAIHQDHGRVARCRTIAISHRTILRRTLHTYVRRVMAKKNGDTVRLRSLPSIHHSAADSKVTKAISYSCRVSFTDGPRLKPNVRFFTPVILVMFFLLDVLSKMINKAHLWCIMIIYSNKWIVGSYFGIIGNMNHRIIQLIGSVKDPSMSAKIFGIRLWYRDIAMSDRF